MKKIFTTLFIIIMLIVAVVVFSLSMDGQRIEREIESIKEESQTSKLDEKIEELESLQLAVEDEITGLKNEFESSIRARDNDFARLEELLNKTDVVETVYGIVTSIYKGEQVSLTIFPMELDDQGEYIVSGRSRTIRLEKDYTPYLASEVGIVPVSRESFLESLENEVENESETPYTFKVVKSRGVQIYQGYIE